MNLAVNAKDAMPDGGKLTIETRNVRLTGGYCTIELGVKPGDYVLLAVSDTGQGIAQETRERIFEPSFTTKEAGKGTGLGLAMVRDIVKHHGGHIACESELAVGTTFRIYLPAMPTEAKSETPAAKPVLSQGTKTILLVDDEEFIRNFGEMVLGRAGYTVTTALSGQEALPRLGQLGSSGPTPS